MAKKVFTQDQANEMYEALKFYQKGIGHFYNCINFAKSALDGEAIAFMNDSGIKINTALRNADAKPKFSHEHK
jgi:hypothetical protein